MSKSDNAGNVIELLRQINVNLSIIRRLTELQLRGAIKEELDKVASTPERKKIWALCDGTVSTSEIARKVGVSSRAVQYFVQEAEEAELVKVDKRGYPYRNVDWIPPEWEEVLRVVAEKKPIKEGVPKNEATQ